MPTPSTARRGALLLPVVAILLLACGGGGGSATEPPSGGDPDATDAASLAPAGERSYVTWDPTLGRIVRIDPDTGDVAELLDLDEGAYAMTQGDGALWMGLESGTVLRIDPTTGEQIAEIPPATSEGLFDIAAADGATWTMHGVPGAGTSLIRIDGSTNTAGTPIPAGTGISFYDVEAGDGAVYVVGTSPTMATTLYVVDPAAGTLTDLEVPMIIDTTAVGGGQVWMGGTFFPEGATTGVPGVGSYDPATGELTTLELPAEPGSIAVGPGAVWAVTGIGPEGTTVYRIDPSTMTLAATIPVGEIEGGRVKISTGAGTAWVTTASGDAYAIDPADDTVAGSADALSTLGLFFP